MRISQNLKEIGMGALILALYLSPGAIALYENNKFRDMGEGFMVRERGKRREFYIGRNYGMTRLCLDKEGDGILDETEQNMPISPFMGGPGYVLIKTQTTDDDQEKFVRANYLYNLNKKEGSN